MCRLRLQEEGLRGRSARSRACELAQRLETAGEAAAEPEEEDDEKPMAACAVDGKTVRASFDADRGVPRTHIVSVRLDSSLTVGRRRYPTSPTS